MSSVARLIFIGTMLTVLAVAPQSARSQDQNVSQSQEQRLAIEKYMADLASEDGSVRREAAYQLTGMGLAAKPALPVLIEALNDREQQVWFQAVTAISRMGPEASDAVPALIGGLNDRGEQKWYRFSHALGMIGPVAVPQLQEAFQSREMMVRAGAAKALNWMGPAAGPAKAELLAALGDESDRVRQEAAEALAEIGVGVLPDLQRLLKSEDTDARVSATIALGLMERDAILAVEDLVAAMQFSDQPEFQARVIDALSHIGYGLPKFSPVLLDNLASPEEVLQQSAINAILRLQAAGKALVPDLIAIMNSEDMESSVRAADVLGRMGPNAEAAVPEIIARIESVSDAGRKTVYMTAVGRIGRPAFLPLLYTLVTEDLRNITDDHWVVKSFAGIGAQLNSDLSTALNSEIDTVRLAALIALKLIGGSAQSAEEAVVKKLTDDVPEVRAAAIGALNGIGTRADRLLPRLETAFADESTLVKLSAVHAARDMGPAAGPFVPTLIRGLEDPESSVQLASIQALGYVGSGAGPAVENLTQRLVNPDAKYRAETVETLGLIGQPAGPAVPVLLGILESDQQELKPVVIDTLADIGSKTDAVVGAFRKFVTDAGPQSRTSALKALQEIEIESAELTGIASGALGDPSLEVRKTAAGILGYIGEDAKGAAPQLVALLDQEEDREYVLDALRSIRSEDLELITGLLSHPGPEVRVYAVQAVALLGNRAQSVVATLESLRENDEEQAVRNEARRTLRRIEGRGRGRGRGN